MFYWVVYQLRRMVWAFDHRGGEWVQGFAAVVSACATLVLVGITWRYTRLTYRLARLAQHQLESSIRIELKIQTEAFGNPGLVVLKLSNKAQAVRIGLVRVGCNLKPQNAKVVHLPPVTVGKLMGKVIGSDEVKSEQVWFTLPDTLKDAGYQDWPESARFAVRVECTDLRGLTQHTFKQSPDGSLTYLPYFESTADTKGLKEALLSGYARVRALFSKK
jgi:hypothetical protein